MTSRPEAAPSARAADLPPQLARRYEAVVLDWDGTAVPDRAADASAARALVEELCRLGFHVGVVTGTNIRNVDPQLGARPEGPGRLYLCLNRGSEVFAVGREGPTLVWRREATPEEEHALDESARLAVERLAERGLRAEVVSQRLNRRKIDIIPEPEWLDPPKARIGELLDAVEARLESCGFSSLVEVVELCEAAARDAGLADPRITSDVKHVEVGLTDKSDSARWMVDELARLGLRPADVLVSGDEFGPIAGLPGSDSLMLVPEILDAVAFSVGVEPNGVPHGVLHVPGGPPRFLDVLGDQLERRRTGELPRVEPEPEWSVELEPDREEPVGSTLATLVDGRLGSHGVPFLPHRGAEPVVLASGIYTGHGPDEQLLECPPWAVLAGAGDPVRRVLDLRTGLLSQDAGSSRAVLFSSLGRPGTTGLRAHGVAEQGTPPVAVVTADPRGGVARATTDRWPASGRIDRISAYVGDPERTPSADEAGAALEGVELEPLLAGHRAAWGMRWAAADVRIEGDENLQRAARFAIFHLQGAGPDSGESAVGARGLTGPGYKGHVFWDTDVFVLPHLAATHPPAARAILEYRLRRLDVARAHARASGRSGARFPWESASTGEDVTPLTGTLPNGQTMPILTGELEEHVTADVAWAAAFYADWTGDRAFAEGPGRTLLVETARYWASRVERDPDGSGHIRHVIGPDEYHEDVDDNAFTNVMVRWNLRRAAAEPGVDEAERRDWLELADSIVDGFDAATKLYEQFAGFYALEPLIAAEIAPKRPIAGEVLLPIDRLHGSQVVKQTDVLMLHHLVPDEVAPGSLAPNLEFYEPRTTHGSSLSPAIHASLLARVGRLDQAVEYLRMSALLDLADVTGSTRNGLHLATMGGVWQALAFGFAGLRPAGAALTVDPRVPDAWGALEVRTRFRGRAAVVRATTDELELRADGPLAVEIPGRGTVEVEGTSRFRRDGDGWRDA